MITLGNGGFDFEFGGWARFGLRDLVQDRRAVLALQFPSQRVELGVGHNRLSLLPTAGCYHEQNFLTAHHGDRASFKGQVGLELIIFIIGNKLRSVVEERTASIQIKFFFRGKGQFDGIAVGIDSQKLFCCAWCCHPK